MEGLSTNYSARSSSQAPAACTLWGLQHGDAGNPALKNLLSNLKLLKQSASIMTFFVCLFVLGVCVHTVFAILFPPCFLFSCFAHSTALVTSVNKTPKGLEGSFGSVLTRTSTSLLSCVRQPCKVRLQCGYTPGNHYQVEKLYFTAFI